MNAAERSEYQRKSVTEQRAQLFAQVEQIEQNGVLIIRPTTTADDYTRRMFACGSVPIRPNGVFYPPADGSSVRHEVETAGPWQTISKVRGLATERVQTAESIGLRTTLEFRIYGMRTLTRTHESGYDMEGVVSIGGRIYRAFTSSVLFELTDGTLCDVGTLYVCKPAEARNA